MLQASTQHDRTRRMTLAVGLSLLVHAVALVAFLWRPVLPAPVLPENQAVVQVLVGTGQPRGAIVAPPAAEQPPPRPRTPEAAAPLPLPPPPQPPKSVEAVRPPPPPSPPVQTTAKPPLPQTKVTATPMQRQTLPMEFGDLGGPLASIDPKKDKSLQVATQPDKANLAPAYPLEAARRGEVGTVALMLHVGADGFVNSVDVVQSSGYPLLDQAAVSRLRTWHFTPAMQAGVPVASIYRIAITFGP